MEEWKLLTRLWSEETKRRERKQGEGGVETPDTSLVRSNQEGTGREEGGEGGAETPDTSLVRGNRRRGERKRRG